MDFLFCYHRLCIKLYLYFVLNFRLNDCEILIVDKLELIKSQKCFACVTWVFKTILCKKWKMLIPNFYSHFGKIIRQKFLHYVT